MSCFGKLAVIPDKPHWNTFRETLAKEVTKHHGPISVTFPKEPTSYPCLASGFLLPVTSVTPGDVTEAKVICCFVYVNEARALLGAIADEDFEVSADDLHATEDLLAGDQNDNPGPEDYAPSQLGTMLLALAVELKAIGAIKSDRLLATYGKIESYLEANVEETYQDDVLTIFEKVMDLPDAC